MFYLRLSPILFKSCMVFFDYLGKTSHQQFKWNNRRLMSLLALRHRTSSNSTGSHSFDFCFFFRRQLRLRFSPWHQQLIRRFHDINNDSNPITTSFLVKTEHLPSSTASTLFVPNISDALLAAIVAKINQTSPAVTTVREATPLITVFSSTASFSTSTTVCP